MRAIVAALIATLCIGCGGSGSTQTGAPDSPAATTDIAIPDATDSSANEAPAVDLGTFKAISLKGKGDKVAKFKIPEDAAAIATITYSGGSNFAIESMGSDGAVVDLLVNTIGKYKGTVLFDANAGEHSVAFKITASGSWVISIKPVSSSRTWAGSSTLKGTGDDVVAVSPPSSGLVTLDLSYRGQGNFAVISYSSSGSDLLANEIGNFSGQTLLPDGTFLLQITAEGSWSATPG